MSMAPGVLVPFEADGSAIREARERLAARAGPLERPLVVTSGYRAPPILARLLRRRLVRLLRCPDEQALAVSFPTDRSVEAAARRLRRVVRGRFGDAALDAAAVSMGGLAVKLAASPMLDDEFLAASDGAAAADDDVGGSERVPLDVRRVFTLATPHRGAILAKLPPIDRAGEQMRPGSAFLDRLHRATPAELEVVAYGRSRDWWVGLENTAPPGGRAFAVRSPWWHLGHLMVSLDARIVTDIALRLRGLNTITA